LASASPRRRDLLAGVGLEFEIKPSLDKEPKWELGQDPQEYALELAKIKGHRIALENRESVVISADTIVVLDKEVLGKPANKQEALKMLMKLSNRPHLVITSFCIQCVELELFELNSVTSTVYMAAFSQEVLQAYLETGEGMDKAGSYAVQGIGSFLVKRIEGSYTNVIGLPVTEVITSLLHANIIKVAVKRDEQCDD